MKYYKPWELLPGDEATINQQIEEAEKIIKKETLQFDVKHPPETEDTTLVANGKPLESTELLIKSSETVGPATDLNLEEPLSSEIRKDTNPDPKSPDTSNAAPKLVESSEASKDLGDDAGEIVLEGEEDTVIY